MMKTTNVSKLLAFLLLAYSTSSQAADQATPGDDNPTGPVIVRVGFQPSYFDPAAYKETPTVSFWLESSFNRVFPTTTPGNRRLSVLTARNARCSFQACLRNDRSWPLDVQCSVGDGQELKPTVRRVGYVPQWNFTADVPKSELDGWGHVPGLVPDPLYPEPKALIGPYGAQSFWITVQVPADAKPGVRKLLVTFTSAAFKEPVTLTAEVEISPMLLQPRQNFPVTHWWNADAIYDWYKQPVFGEKWWEIMPAYLNNMLEHGSDVILVPIFYMRREIVERPSQLLIINEPSPGKYEFDWSRVKRFVDMAKKAGFKQFEWSHFWTYKVVPTESSVDMPQRLYKWVDGKAQLLWPKDTPATGEIYRNFLKQFLPEFHSFLRAEHIVDQSYFHLSDEPGGDPKDLANYRKARELLKELAPWMKVIDAMSDIRYGREPGLTDIPGSGGPCRAGLHRREDPALGVLLRGTARPVSEPVLRYFAGKDPHVRVAVPPAGSTRLPALGLQLLVRDGFELQREDTGAGGSVYRRRSRHDRRRGGGALRRFLRSVSGRKRPHRFHPVGGVCRVAAGLRAPPDRGHQAR